MIYLPKAYALHTAEIINKYHNVEIKYLKKKVSALEENGAFIPCIDAENVKGWGQVCGYRSRRRTFRLFKGSSRYS